METPKSNTRDQAVIDADWGMDRWAEGSRPLTTGGEAGIRTLDTAFRPYNGLANRRLQPLGHLTVRGFPKDFAIRLARIGYCRASVPTSVPKPTRGVPQISIADDIIAIEDAARLVTAQFHRHALRNAGADHVPEGGPTEVSCGMLPDFFSVEVLTVRGLAATSSSSS